MPHAIAQALVVATTLVPLAAVAAAEPPPITEATAVWTDEGKVELSVTYDGGACDEPGDPRVEAGPTTTDAVFIPTTETAEVCTMQIVPVTYEGVIPVEPDTRTLAITVLDFKGQPKATGSVDIETGTEIEEGESSE